MIADLTQIVITLALLVVLAVPLGLYMAEGLHRRDHLDPASPSGRCWRWRRHAQGRAALDDLHAGAARLYRGGLRRAVPDPQVRVRPAAQPQGFDGLPRTSPSTPRSRSSPTPTGRAMAARTTMSLLSQMVGLTTQNFVSAASGMAVAAAVARGLASRQVRTLGTPGATSCARSSTCCCRSRSRWRWRWCFSVCSSTLDASVSRTRWRAPSRRSRRSGSQIAIKQLGTNGGGFFTLILAIRSRTLICYRTSSR